MRGQPYGAAFVQRNLSRAIILLIFAIVVGQAGCRRSRGAAAFDAPKELAGGGVRISRIGPHQMPVGAAIRGRTGDWLLETNGMKVVVGGDAQGAAAELSRGTLLDVSNAGWQHEGLDQLALVLLRASAEEPLLVRSIEPVMLGAAPVLRVVHETRDGRLELVSHLRLLPGAPYVELVTEIRNRSSASLSDLSLADRVHWMHKATFAPGIGEVEGDARARVHWVGAGSEHLSYALTFPAGPTNVEFRADAHGPSGLLAASDAFTLGPQQVRTYRRLLVVATGNLEHAAEIAWPLANVRIGHAFGVLDPVPSWATVEALSVDGKPMLKVAVPSTGKFRLPLPAGQYLFKLRSPGGFDEESVQVQREQDTAVRFLVPNPRRLHYRVTDALLQPIAVRLVLRGIAPTADPDLGPGHLASGAGNVTYATLGEAQIELPAGRYRVLATHGIEYGIAERDIDVTTETGATLRMTLPHLVDTKTWLPCDFHLHADPSGDSEVSLRDRVISLLAEGVEFAVPTDHNVVTDYAPAVAELDAGARIATTPGVEVTTAKWGHFNSFPYPLGEPPAYSGVTPSELFGSIRTSAPNALIQINHPRMGDIGYFYLGGLDAATGVAEHPDFSLEFDTIEVFNGFERDVKSLERNLADWFGLLNLGRRNTAVGNSDSHRVLVQWAGYPRTYVRLDEDTPQAVRSEAVIDALRRGRAMVTSGPFVEFRANGAELGATVRPQQGRVQLALTVRAPPWIKLAHVRFILNGRTERELALPPSVTIERLRYRGELNVSEDGWLVVVVWGDTNLDLALPGAGAIPFAFTNPIYVDADGDGAVRPSARFVPGDAGISSRSSVPADAGSTQ